MMSPRFVLRVGYPAMGLIILAFLALMVFAPHPAFPQSSHVSPPAHSDDIDSVVVFFDAGSDVIKGKVPNLAGDDVDVIGVYAGADSLEWKGFGKKATKAIDGGLIVQRARNLGRTVGLKKFFIGTLVEKERVAKIFFRQKNATNGTNHDGAEYAARAEDAASRAESAAARAESAADRAESAGFISLSDQVGIVTSGYFLPAGDNFYGGTIGLEFHFDDFYIQTSGGGNPKPYQDALDVQTILMGKFGWQANKTVAIEAIAGALWNVPKPYDQFTDRKFFLGLGPDVKVLGPIHASVAGTYVASFNGDKEFRPLVSLGLR